MSQSPQAALDAPGKGAPRLSDERNLAISAIVPVARNSDHLVRCLAALAHAAPPADEIIVVLDGGDPLAAEIAEGFGARVLETPAQQGPAAARNLGAAAAQGELLLFVDADVLVSPDVVDRVASAFCEEPELAAIFGSYDAAPAAANFLSQYKNLFHHFVHQTGREEASTFWSGCGAIRRDLFLSLGGFDEAYRQPAIEDIELGYRLTQGGYRIRLDKGLQVKHLKQWGPLSLIKTDFLNRGLPWTRLILRDRRLIDDLNLRPASRLSVFLAYACLVALAGAWWLRGLVAVTVLFGLALVALNGPLFRFFLSRRGPWFALRTIPWVWLYYLYSGLAFAVGSMQHLWHRWEGWGLARRRDEGRRNA